jgi:hypothetical protein
MARRVATPPPWLAARTSRPSAAAQDVLLAGAGATLACVHGCWLIPSLAQAEGYFRAVAPKLFPGRGDGLLNRSRGEPVRGGPWKADGSAQPCKQAPDVAWHRRTGSAMCPWTPQHPDPGRYTMRHHGTKQKRPAGPGIGVWRDVSAGGGRCWVRTSVGLADGFTARSR